MKNLLILLGILLSSPFVVAQHLAINGNVAIADNSPEGTRVVVTKNGNKLDEQVLNKKGHFDLKLAFDADYKISFEKTGYITKIVSINTEVPEESIENNPDFPPVKLIINLLPSVEKIDLSIFDQPIAILTYQAELDDFTFDKSYSDKIKDRIAQTEQAVKKQLAARDAAAARGAEVALFGHTHKPIALQKNGVFLFNPGSCGRCYTGPNTYGVMLLDKGKITSFAHKEVPQQ